MPVEGVVAIALLGAVAVAAGAGERRRRRAVEAFRVAQASLEEAPPEAGDLEPGWDPSDDETVATIDYDGLDDPDEDA